MLHYIPVDRQGKCNTIREVFLTMEVAMISSAAFEDHQDDCDVCRESLKTIR